jgi:hypothetical protein
MQRRNSGQAEPLQGKQQGNRQRADATWRSGITAKFSTRFTGPKKAACRRSPITLGCRAIVKKPGMAPTTE